MKHELPSTWSNEVQQLVSFRLLVHQAYLSACSIRHHCELHTIPLPEIEAMKNTAITHIARELDAMILAQKQADHESYIRNR